MEDRIRKTMENLERNKMKPYFVENREQLIDIVRGLVKNDKLITSGGSATLKESGVIEMLQSEFASAFAARPVGGSAEQMRDFFRSEFSSDTFLASTNALTEDGELYNVDGNGNRVAAMIYGPTQVIIVTGVNKIVKDLTEAKERVEKIAAPLNTKRLNSATPCKETGRCEHCHSDQRICCSYVTLAQQRVPDRIKVIIVNEKLGF